MNEKIYKTMSFSGVTAIVTGIIVISFGVTAGVMMIVSGAKLIKDKAKIMF